MPPPRRFLGPGLGIALERKETCFSGSTRRPRSLPCAPCSLGWASAWRWALNRPGRAARPALFLERRKGWSACWRGQWQLVKADLCLGLGRCRTSPRLRALPPRGERWVVDLRSQFWVSCSSGSRDPVQGRTAVWKRPSSTSAGDPATLVRTQGWFQECAPSAH